MTTNTKSLSLDQLRTPEPPEARMPAVRSGMGDLQGFELLQRVAKAIAASSLVPPQFQGNLPNCIIALEMAQRLGASPLMICQNLFLVHGRPGWSAKFLIASFNESGRFSAVRYEWQGDRDKDTWGCKAYATEKVTGEKIVGPLITLALAKKEGWYEKAGSKWKTIPELMLMYRAAAWMVNTHAPEISMGLNTQEELGDIYDATQANGNSYFIEELRREKPPVTIANAESNPDIQPAPAAEQSKPSPAAIEQLLRSAGDVDVLDAHADLIREVEDEPQAFMLAALYRNLREKLTEK